MSTEAPATITGDRLHPAGSSPSRVHRAGTPIRRYAARDQLTLGERAADKMRNGMGSWAFVFAALAFLAVWMLFNGVRGHSRFDPYPFILLNLVLSCLAAMQGAILLIAAKRSDQIAAELAQHDYETDSRAEQLIEALRATSTRCARSTSDCTTSSASSPRADDGVGRQHRRNLRRCRR